MLPERTCNSGMASDEADFSGLIAATVHDMKNSLNIVLNSLDGYIQESDSKNDPRLRQLQCEAKRLTNKLIQLLSFYRLSNTTLTANIDECCVYDLLIEVLLQEEAVLSARDIEADIVCEEDLIWVLDRELITGVLSNAINNAARHTQRRLLLEATVIDKELVISVQDDGAGFPEDILIHGMRQDHGVSFSTGNTGLGLYFSQTIAQLHRNNNRTGRINLSNNNPMSGGCFSLILP